MTFLETDRLLLRNVSAADADEMYDYRNHEKCARYQRGQTKDYNGIVRLLQERCEDSLSVDTPCLMGVELKAGGQFIGEIVVMPNEGAISLGYTFSYKHHRCGYAFEALGALMHVLHDRYPTWEFVCFTDPENTASMGLLKKLGYTDYGYLASRDSRVFGKWMTPEGEQELLAATGKDK